MKREWIIVGIVTVLAVAYIGSAYIFADSVIDWFNNMVSIEVNAVMHNAYQ